MVSPYHPLLDGHHHTNEREGRLIVYRNGLGWQAEDLADALDGGEAGDIASIDAGDAAAAGTSNEVARADHQHAMNVSGGGSDLQVFTAGSGNWTKPTGGQTMALILAIGAGGGGAAGAMDQSGPE